VSCVSVCQELVINCGEMSGAVAFSSDGETAMTRRLSPVTTLPLSLENQAEVEAYFELQRCTQWIKDGQYERVIQTIYLYATLIYITIL